MREPIEFYIRFPSGTGGLSRTSMASGLLALKREIIFAARECRSRENEAQRIVIGGSSHWLRNTSAIHEIFTTLDEQLELSLRPIPIIVTLDPADITQTACKLIKRYHVSALVLRVGSFSDELLRKRKAQHTVDDSTGALKLFRNYGFEPIVTELWNDGSSMQIEVDQRAILDYDIDAVRLRCSPDKLGDSSLLGLGAALEKASYNKSGNLYVHPDRRYSPLISCAETIIGLGPGAKTLTRDIKGDRSVTRCNPDNLHTYIRYINKAHDLYHKREHSRLIREYEAYIFTALMRHGNLNLDELEKTFQVPLEKIHPGLIEILTRHGYITCNERNIRFTQEGRKLAGNVISNFSLCDVDEKYFYRYQKNTHE